MEPREAFPQPIGGRFVFAHAQGIDPCDPSANPIERSVSRLFMEGRECSKEEHATQWLCDWIRQYPERATWPSAQRVRHGVKAKYALTISKPTALAAVTRLRGSHGAAADLLMETDEI
jgi:hypothetical protein